MYYSIAGHIIEIRGREPDRVSGFSPFILDCIYAESLVSIRLNEKIAYRKAKLVYQFTIEKGICSLLKKDDDYVVHWQQTDGTSWLMKIYPSDGRFIASTNMNKDTDIHILEFSIWIAFGIATLHRQTVAIHASTIIHNDRSILFLGESGTGKSTQSQLWLQHIPNTELLNDDSPFIRTGNEEKSIVYGSPWSGKTPCYKNRNTPIAALVRLRQAPYNSIKRLRTIEAIGALQPSLPPLFASEPILTELMLECLSSILRQIPVYALDCLPNEDAANLAYTTLRKDGWL